MADTSTICCYCGTGCGVIVETGADGRVSGVRGDPAHPANAGRLCSKGANLHLTVRDDASRVLFPELRRAKTAARQRASWDEALDFAAAKFAAIIREHGPDSVAFYVSGQLLSEDYYVFNKLARGLIGTNNIDSNSRLCMSSAVSGYKRTLGADAPPACYDDIGRAGCILIAGSNTAYAHPIVFRRIEAAKLANPGLKLIVIDPRRTDTAAAADLHLALLPGSDVALFHGMLHVMLWDGLTDAAFIRNHSEGFEALRETVRAMTPQAAARLCGVAEADIVQAARWFAQSPATLSLWCQGLNQSSHGSDKNAALINLHLATGQIGKAGAGPFSLTGQPNAMGGREVGAMANLLAGHRDINDPAQRAEVAKLWGVENLPERPGKTAVELFQALESGEIKAVWIACTNPAQSLPNQAQVRRALEAAELVVLQEAFSGSETAAYADLLLPAATWPEKDGTMTNSERRIARVRAAIAPPGEAHADWEIAVDFARRLEKLLLNEHPPLCKRGARGDLTPAAKTGTPQNPPPPPFDKGGSLFPYACPEEIFNEHRATTQGRDLDISGLSYALLESQGPQQWPFPEHATAGRKRLYQDGIFPTASGRAHFVNVAYLPPAESADARFPFSLNTGRLRDQWHGMSRTGLAAHLYSHGGEAALEMHPDDLARRGLQDGDWVTVTSRRGAATLKVRASTDLRGGQVFLPMHWGGGFIGGAGVNALTSDVCDPLSHQPELKHAAVRVEKLALPLQLVALRKGDALRRMARVRALLPQFAAASLALAGREEAVLVLRAASATPFDAALLAELDRLLEMDDDATALTYRDARRGIAKRVTVEDGAITGARLTNETAAANWLMDGMAQGLAFESVRAWVLAPLSAPPMGGMERGRVVCNCLNVTETEIKAEIAASSSLAAIQEKLKCGTQCGSCVPELKRMVEFSGAISCKK